MAVSSDTGLVSAVVSPEKVELEVRAEEMVAGRVAVKNNCIAVYLAASPVLLAHAAAAAAHEIVDLNLAAHAHAPDLLRLPAQLAHRGAIWRDSASAAAPPRATPSHLSTARSGQSSAGVGDGDSHQSSKASTSVPT